MNLNGGRVLDHGPPPRESQLSNGWNNLNQSGCYLPTQTYQSPDPVVQHVLNQQHHTAQMASHYQLVTEQNARRAEEKAMRAEQEIARLCQELRQQPPLQILSLFAASMPNVNAPLAGQLAAQAAASAASPVSNGYDCSCPRTCRLAPTRFIARRLIRLRSLSTWILRCNRWILRLACSCTPICHSPRFR